MTYTQPELGQYRKASTRKRKSPELARRMIARLMATPDRWVTRADLKACGMTDRECRLASNAAHGRIIFTSAGFRITAISTEAEVMECYNKINSMIEALQRKGAAVMRRWHGRKV